MKRFMTYTYFLPLTYSDSVGFKYFYKAGGGIIKFNSRSSVEHFCDENLCTYVEQKFTFFR